MKTICKLAPAALGMFVACACGCASIVSGRNATVEIESQPSNADVVVRDKHGKEVVATHTPASVQLKRKDGFLMPASYTATIEKPGYSPEIVPIRSTVNPWILGNVVFGGIIGLAIDNTTGAAWQPKQRSIQKNLTPMRPGEPASAEVSDQTANVVVEGRSCEEVNCVGLARCGHEVMDESLRGCEVNFARFVFAEREHRHSRGADFLDRSCHARFLVVVQRVNLPVT